MSLNPWRGERIGNLRERVTLEKRIETQDPGTGEPIIDWTPLATVFARVEPLKGEERFVAHQVVASHHYRVFIRYRDDMTVLDRVVWNGLELGIQATSNPDERRRFLQIDCEAANP